MQNKYLEDIFTEIRENTNIKLDMISQFKIKLHIERQISYLCKDVFSKKNIY